MLKTTRIAALQKLLRKQKLPALLITDPLNIRYLTNLKATEALVLVKPTSATLLVDGRYIEVARALPSKNLRVVDRSDLPTLMKRIPRCAFEGHSVTAERLERWKKLFKKTQFVQTLGLIEGLRRKKDSQEIRLMKRALSITNDVICLVPGMLTPGVTEKHVANRILFEMLERGADGTAFESIVAFGKNSSLPHHRAGPTKLRSRDIVQIDCGAKYDGYCADRSEVFFVGKPLEEWMRAYDAVSEVRSVVNKELKAGAKCKALDEFARDFLAKKSYPPYPHALGHGVGMDVHEGVVLAGRSSDSLLSEEAIAIEPGVYFEGKFGIRLEDTVFVK